MRFNKNSHKKLQVYEEIRREHGDYPKLAIEKITSNPLLSKNPCTCIICGEFQPSILTHKYCIPCVNSAKAFRHISNKVYAYMHLIGQKFNNDVEQFNNNQIEKKFRENEPEVQFVHRIVSSGADVEKKLKILLRSKIIFPDKHTCRICKTVDKNRSVTKVCKTCLGTLHYGKAQKFKYLSMIVEHVRNNAKERMCVKEQSNNLSQNP
jgi:hypothetical protein